MALYYLCKTTNIKTKKLQSNTVSYEFAIKFNSNTSRLRIKQS
ncbi:hypothetical protein H1P_80037 [Hyella patelloides LEGE 07179]|uniref:Uncharacterized protein n=1 Tax=Hyella patelloides LEGE 07179 TaxID=945734 RepID=A0A563W459_9CYAN|nr:hypothetical protein H1P_80037 [Hyella patelloides LEGE 07179]